MGASRQMGISILGASIPIGYAALNTMAERGQGLCKAGLHTLPESSKSGQDRRPPLISSQITPNYTRRGTYV